MENFIFYAVFTKILDSRSLSRIFSRSACNYRVAFYVIYPDLKIRIWLTAIAYCMLTLCITESY